jgi:Zn-dependent M28 family amino/carboxypeptidase
LGIGYWLLGLVIAHWLLVIEGSDRDTMSRVIGGRRVVVVAGAGTLLTVALVVVAAGQRGASPPTAPAPPAIDETTLLNDLRVLSADDMAGRRTGTAGAARARAYITGRFAASGIERIGDTYEHPFPLGPRRAGETPAEPGVNVIGRVRGHQFPDRYLVVSAHYDHAGVERGVVYNGANDNASGVAALMALGRYFSTRPAAHSLIFAAFDAEEPGLIGARAFVGNPPVDRRSLVFNLNADMIGRDPDNVLWVAGTRQQPEFAPLVTRVASRAPVVLRMGHDDPSGRGGENWIQNSDQWAFLEAGIPALYVGVEDTEHFHRPTDDYANMTHAFYVNAVETIRMLIEEVDRSFGK